MKRKATLLKELAKKFPDVWAKDGAEWDNCETRLVWSGEGSYMPDGLKAFDPWVTDYEEKQYTMMVHNDLHEWAKKNGCYWECNDPGTFFLFRV